VTSKEEAQHKLSPDEDRLWERLKKEPNTYEDWEDLNTSIVAYQRRYIARHSMLSASTVDQQLRKGQR
jgi:hypothetical protein